MRIDPYDLSDRQEPAMPFWPRLIRAPSRLLSGLARATEDSRYVQPRSRLRSEAAFIASDGGIFYVWVHQPDGRNWPPKLWEARGRWFRRETTRNPGETALDDPLRGRLVYREVG